jgi:chromosome partitioning protein
MNDSNAPATDGNATPGLDEVSALYAKAMAVMARLRADAVNRETGQKEGPRYSITRAATLAGCASSDIRQAEKSGALPPKARLGNGHRVGYALAEIDAIRALLGTRPWRDPNVPPAILACQNFKGGVGKSTIAVHLAQYLAIRGYRVCLIDCDSQASATMMFGYVPDIDLEEDDTLYGYMHDESGEGLRPRVRPTYFHGLDLVPANLKLYNLEYEIAASMAQSGNFDLIDQIKQAISTISDDYDVIILDPPPALGMVSLGVLSAANALIVPMPPSIVDFASTASFLDMLNTTMKSLEAMTSLRPVYNFVRLLTSRADESKSMHREIMDMGRQLFGASMLKAVLRDSAEIDNAISRLRTVYELERPITSYSVHRRCVRQLDAVNGEIEGEIRAAWDRAAEADLLARKTGGKVPENMTHLSWEVAA